MPGYATNKSGVLQVFANEWLFHIPVEFIYIEIIVCKRSYLRIRQS